ncbi:hypothetical protein NPX13_g1020 [Xylaria arbuscula]|uniref:Uncharacterized protein n=1 Tax=Xylaria arbuscula TaxID=114810 RepID=A0A9W8NMT7_9PEZI|nr:hypothetical protein NPX13_g1020 [Xylaria arbuscula]
MAGPSIADLEAAALSVIHLLQDAAELSNVQIALVGDLAVRKYLAEPRPCESIEFIIKRASPGSVKKTLLSLAKQKKIIVEEGQALFYRHPKGWTVEVKFTPEWLCPYLPSSVQMIKTIEKLPYISLPDLIVFTVDGCGLHESDESKQREARDACALMELASEHSALILEENKLQKIEEALDTLEEYSPFGFGRRWWELRLGKQGDKLRTAQDILSELGEGLRLEDEKRRATRRSSIFSLNNTRGSDTSISSTSSISSQSTTPLSSPPPKMRPRKMSVSGTYPRPRRHTQVASDQLPLSPLDYHYPDIHRVHAASIDNRGRSSPGISLMRFPGKGA